MPPGRLPRVRSNCRSSGSAGANRQRRRHVLLAVALLFALLGATMGWRLYRESRVKWARETALPEIAKLIQAEHLVAAFDLASQAALDIPSDPVLVKEWHDITRTIDVVESTPPGAQISYREYGVNGAPWRVLGLAPMTNTRLPVQCSSGKRSSPGSSRRRTSGGPSASDVRFTLQRPESLPPGMVRATTGAAPFALQIPGLDVRRYGSVISSSIGTRSPTVTSSGSWTPAGTRVQSSGASRLFPTAGHSAVKARCESLWI